MPAKIYYDKDTNLGVLEGKKVGVIGYGSQGHAHAQNLKDSGVQVSVGLYPDSKSWSRVQEAGIAVGTVDDVARDSDVIMMLVPDQLTKQVYEEHVLPHMEPGKTLMFAHGFNIHFNQIAPLPGVDVSMIAPKGPGHLVRARLRCRPRWHTARASAPRARASSRRPSARRPRPTSSVSR